MSSYNSHAGHNPDGKIACGAIGLIKESTENRKVNNEIIRLLKEENQTVYDCTVNDGLSVADVVNKIVRKANSHKVDLDVSIHFNSGAKDEKGNGRTTGVEVLIYDDSARKQAERICERISKLGFKNRGVKVRADLGVLRNTNAPALLVECCFVDDADDIKLYNYKTMAKAIVEGILNKKIGTEEETDMNKLVIYAGDIDALAAVVVAQKHKCPLMKKIDFDKSGLRVKEVIYVGGKKEDTDRFESMKNACKYL